MIFSGVGKGKITLIGYVCISALICIKNALYVKELKYNLLRKRKLCGRGYIISSNKDTCVISSSNEQIVFIAR